MATTTPRRASRRASADNWWAVDGVAVLVFAAIGRMSHSEGLSLSGVVETAFPFLAGCLLGWGLVEWRDWDPLSMVAAAGVLVPTVLVGMVGRHLLGDGTAPAFIAVATITLGVLYAGWRLLVKVTRRQS